MYENSKTEPEKLVTYLRDGLIEQEHFGYVVRADKFKIIEKLGEDNNYPFYMRSCAKPLQASLLIDYELDKKFDLSEQEIAVCCSSHTGEELHINLVKSVLEKFCVSENELKCGKHEPISKTAQHNLIKQGQKASAIHNNCSGKHALMLGLCKINNWDIKTYDQPNHPLQQKIKNKIYTLCRLKSEYPVTKDGCGVPIAAMPLANMVTGFLNLFCDSKYEKIKNAFLNNPYIIGGENRTDTKIISNTKNIISKVGAGGLCIVVNTELEEGFIVKICDSNMEAREFVTIDLINNLHWGNIKVSHEIKTLHNDKVGNVITKINH